MTHTMALFGQFGWAEILVLALVGLLLFGKRLPEVGRSLGKGIVEFKKGLQGIESDLDSTDKAPPADKHLEDKSQQNSIPDSQPRRQADASDSQQNSKSS